VRILPFCFSLLTLSQVHASQTPQDAPKAPLTHKQLNELPPEVQANIKRALPADLTQQKKRTDGSQSKIYAVDEYSHADAQHLNAQKTPEGAPAGGTLIAESALNLKGASNAYGNVTVHNLGDVKEAAFQAHKKGTLIKKLTFVDATDLMHHFDQYAPYLSTAEIISLEFPPQQDVSGFVTSLKQLILNLDAFSETGGAAKKLKQTFTLLIPEGAAASLLSPEDLAELQGKIKTTSGQNRPLRLSAMYPKHVAQKLGIQRDLGNWNISIKY
jgi:hypothetical protein